MTAKLGSRLNLDRPEHPDSILSHNRVPASAAALSMTFLCYSTHDPNSDTVLENPEARASDGIAEGIVVHDHPEEENSYLHHV